MSSRSDDKTAAALQYRPLEALPVVISSGRGPMAELITSVAETHQVPIIQDPKLAELLVGEGDHRPICSSETLRLVAEVVCFLCAAEEELRQAKVAASTVLPTSSVG